MTILNRRLVNKTDFIIIGLIIAVMLFCFTFFSNRQNGILAEIYLNGKLIKSLSLDTDANFDLNSDNPEYPLMGFSVENGSIFVSSADCHDKICMNTGKINGGYQTIVCLPNRIVVKINDNNTNSNIDLIL